MSQGAGGRRGGRFAATPGSAVNTWPWAEGGLSPAEGAGRRRDPLITEGSSVATTCHARPAACRTAGHRGRRGSLRLRGLGQIVLVTGAPSRATSTHEHRAARATGLLAHFISTFRFL